MAKILGINDEVTTCDCCGKVNLKKTVAIEIESGDVVRYGVDCASKVFRAKNVKGDLSKISPRMIGNIAAVANVTKTDSRMMRLYR